MSDSIPVILAGFGWWARNRTVIPILEQNQDLMEVIAVTSLKRKRKEFQELVEPVFKSRGWNLPFFVEELDQALNEMRYERDPAQ